MNARTKGLAASHSGVFTLIFINMINVIHFPCQGEILREIQDKKLQLTMTYSDVGV